MSEEVDRESVKIVAVGDGAIGKTCLLETYEKNEFPTQHVPTIFENVTLEKDISLNGENIPISLDLWDTAGQEQFDRLRILAYRETDVFLLCFSIADLVTFENMQSKWIPEITHHAPKALIVLVGLKCDLKDEQEKLKEEGREIIPESTINAYKTQCGAVAYVETSALKRINVDKAFETAIGSFLKGPNDDGQPASSGGSCCTVV